MLDFPDAEGLRPTPDRVRETLFNWLGQDLTGKRCLDLFAGSGALGFEAASRGAEQVVMVEASRTVFRALQANLRKLGCDNVVLLCKDALEFVRGDGEGYDVIFLDPPFRSDLAGQVLPELAGRLRDDGLVYLESGDAFEPPAPWKTIKQARAGNVHFKLLQRGRNDT